MDQSHEKAQPGADTETPHNHEAVKDIDELIAAMDDVDEGMPEEGEESQESDKEEDSDKDSENSKEDEEESEEKDEIPVIQDSEEVKKAKERLAQIKAKVLTLRWDVEHGQINPAKKALYEKLKPEYDSLVRTIEASGQKA